MSSFVRNLRASRIAIIIETFSVENSVIRFVVKKSFIKFSEFMWSLEFFELLLTKSFAIGQI